MSKIIRALTAALGTYEVYEISTKMEAERLARHLADAGHAVTCWQAGNKWMVKA